MEEKNMPKCDKLYEIYNTFIEQLVNCGWKGKFYGWKESVQYEIYKGSSALFEFGNGFRLEFKEPSENCAEDVTLRYWFENDQTVVEVKNLEQLLALL